MAQQQKEHGQDTKSNFNLAKILPIYLQVNLILEKFESLNYKIVTFYIVYI